MEENIFDKIKNTVHKPQPKPAEPKVTKISDIKSTTGKISIFPYRGLTPMSHRLNLYFERWNIETKYRELKEWWELEEFTGTSCNSIEQELYINLLFSNLAALVKAEADSIVKQKAFIKNKWAYQSKRTFIIGEVKALVPQLLFMSIEILPVITNLILKASKKRSQIHPGRCYERSKKNRDRKHLRTRKSVL